MVQEHVASLKPLLTQVHVDYALFDTSTPLDDALFTYLSARERLTRGTARAGVR